MKKIIRIFLLSVAIFCVCTPAVFADFGSKPRVEINLKNAPREEYYLDLLYQPSRTTSMYDNLYKGAVYNEDMLRTLRSYEKDGWYAALASGTLTPVFGSLTGENGRHVFSYIGVPDEFKIIIVTAGGDVKISRPVKRRTMEVSLDVDFADMSVNKKSARIMYFVQFAGSLAATLVIEFAVLLLFRYGIKENSKVFLLTNIFTQLIFSVLFSTVFLFGGTFGTLLAFIPLEIGITAVEIFIYKRKLKGRSPKINVMYALCANLASAALTYRNLEFILTLMTKLII